MILDYLSLLAIYDWITILYIVIGIVCFIWVSTGNDYIFKKIEKLIKEDPAIEPAVRKSDIYYIEIRKSWLHNQNIWIAVEYFLVGLAYLSMVIVLYITVDNIVNDRHLLDFVLLYMLQEATVAYLRRFGILFAVKIKHPDHYYDNQQIKKYVLKNLFKHVASFHFAHNI